MTGNTLQFKSNVVFEYLEQAAERYIVQQGGTRSGKTYNIILWLCFSYCLQNNNQGKTITICRKTFPSLRASVMRDFVNILTEHELYFPDAHNKSSHEYTLFGNTVEFISLDQPQKIRGRKRDLVFINEANELTYEDFFQLNIRTTEKVIMDFNPSEEFHWIYDKIIPREDCRFDVTTYLDNPFLDESLRLEIEKLKDTDEQYWKIYGLGERAQSRAVIFTFNTRGIPSDAQFLAYGLDWGFSNDPTALVAVYSKGDELYFEELLYEVGMTNSDIANRLKDIGVQGKIIYADSAEPKSIEELKRWGFRIRPASKGRDSVNAGIDILRRHKLYWTEASLNGIKEMRNYKWKQDRNGQTLNQPVDAFNHLIDALRYAVYMTKSKPNYGQYYIR